MVRFKLVEVPSAGYTAEWLSLVGRISQLAVSDKVRDSGDRTTCADRSGRSRRLEFGDRVACWRLRIGKKRSALTSGIPAARLARGGAAPMP